MESAYQPSSTTTTAASPSGLLEGDGARSVSTAGGTVRGRTGNLQAQLADALDSGAGVIRQRASSLSAAQGTGATEGSATNVLERVTPQVLAQGELAAKVMERGAVWLRENDLSDVEGRLVGELKQNPLRTLGIAAVLGFLVAGRRR